MHAPPVGREHTVYTKLMLVNALPHQNTRKALREFLVIHRSFCEYLLL